MSNNTFLPFGFPAVGRKKLIAAFDGGRITTDGDVLLLGMVERRLGIATKLARLIADPRNPALVTHSVDDILRTRILARLLSGSGVVISVVNNQLVHSSV